MKKKLFIFDFDGTIVSGHTHNTIIRAQNTDDPEYINGPWGVVHDFPIIGSTDTWKNIFEDINQQGHYAAINSFNSFGPIIPEFMEKIGLDDDFIKEVHIIAKLPANPAKENKNAYIQESIAKAIEKSGEKKDFSGDVEDVFLIDDSKKNIEAAKQAGYQVIHAKKDGSHLIELQNKLEELKKLDELEEKPPVVDRLTKPKYLNQDQEVSRFKEMQQQIKTQESLRIENLKTINQLENNKSLLPQEKLTLAALKSEVEGIELSIKAKYDHLKEENEKLVSPIVDSNKPKHVESIQTKKQDAVSTEVNKQSSLQTQKLKDKQDQQTLYKPTVVDSSSKKNEKLEELLKAKPKKNELWEKSQSPVSTKVTNLPPQEASAKLIDELKAKQALKALKGPSTFFGSGNASTSRDNTKTQEEKTKTAPKQFSR